MVGLIDFFAQHLLLPSSFVLGTVEGSTQQKWLLPLLLRAYDRRTVHDRRASPVSRFSSLPLSQVSFFLLVPSRETVQLE